MGIWSAVKYALNSTLGTSGFKPLDQLLTDNIGKASQYKQQFHDTKPLRFNRSVFETFKYQDLIDISNSGGYFYGFDWGFASTNYYLGNTEVRLIVDGETIYEKVFSNGVTTRGIVLQDNVYVNTDGTNIYNSVIFPSILENTDYLGEYRAVASKVGGSTTSGTVYLFPFDSSNPFNTYTTASRYLYEIMQKPIRFNNSFKLSVKAVNSSGIWAGYLYARALYSLDE